MVPCFQLYKEYQTDDEKFIRVSSCQKLSK